MEKSVVNSVNESLSDSPPAKKIKIDNGESNKESDTDWNKLQKEISEMVGSNPAIETIQFLQQADPSQKFIELPSLEKDARRQLHLWIKSRIDNFAKADTHEGRIRIWHTKFEQDMPNFSKFRSTRPSGIPKGYKYLQFVLYKENTETAAAISQIQRRAGGQGRGKRRGRGRGGGPSQLRIGYAGMKDKRGITSQFVTVPSSTPLHKLASINNSQDRGNIGNGSGRSIIRVGNYEYVQEESRLGRLKGNHFSIALRNVRVEDDSDVQERLETAAKALSDSGFINYFGAQRFGKFHDTHLCGFCVIKGDYQGAIDIIMSPKPGERSGFVSARELWQDRFQGVQESDKRLAEQECAKRILPEFGNFMQSERAVLQSLARDPLDYKKAFECIGKTMRMMFVHAVQSFLWNHAVTSRFEKLGTKIVAGDLVMVDCSSGSDDRPGLPKVVVVTTEDIESKRYRLDDVVMPLLGSKTIDPTNESAKVFDEILSRHDISRHHLTSIAERDFNAAGDYRKILCCPKNVGFRIIKYEDPHQPLIRTDLMALENVDILEQGSDTSLVGMAIDFTLPSSAYATICLRELMKAPTSSEYQGSLELGK